jgi:hypothetical protein
MSAESIKAGIQGLLSVPGPIKSSLGEPKIADRAKGFDYGALAPSLSLGLSAARRSREEQ